MGNAPSILLFPAFASKVSVAHVYLGATDTFGAKAGNSKILGGIPHSVPDQNIAGNMSPLIPAVSASMTVAIFAL